MSKVTRSGLTYVSLGLLLLVIRALLDHWEAVKCTMIGTIFLDLLRDIGIGCIVLGMFNLILSRADWQEYFEDRLREIVMGHEFLRSLGASALRQMVRAAIRAQTPGAAVEREGGFLEFFGILPGGGIAWGFFQKGAENKLQTDQAAKET
jgi:hypothetical protein